MRIVGRVSPPQGVDVDHREGRDRPKLMIASQVEAQANTTQLNTAGHRSSVPYCIGCEHSTVDIRPLAGLRNRPYAPDQVRRTGPMGLARMLDYRSHLMRAVRIQRDRFGGDAVGADGLAPGSAKLHLVDGIALMRPEEQAFAAMLDGWRNQQLSRRLALSTIESRERMVRAFSAHADAFPWDWRPQPVDDWMTDLRAVRNLRRSTLRGYQLAVKLFCSYVTDPAYGWPAECELHFGTHPIQVVHEWNAAVHVQDAEGDPTRRLHTRRPAGVPRLRRQRGGAAPRGWPQGLAGCLPRCRPVQGRLRLRASPQRGADARRHRLRAQRPRSRVR